MITVTLEPLKRSQFLRAVAVIVKNLNIFNL